MNAKEVTTPPWPPASAAAALNWFLALPTNPKRGWVCI